MGWAWGIPRELQTWERQSWALCHPTSAGMGIMARQMALYCEPCQRGLRWLVSCNFPMCCNNRYLKSYLACERNNELYQLTFVCSDICVHMYICLYISPHGQAGKEVLFLCVTHGTEWDRATDPACPMVCSNMADKGYCWFCNSLWILLKLNVWH